MITTKRCHLRGKAARIHYAPNRLELMFLVPEGSRVRGRLGDHTLLVSDGRVTLKSDNPTLFLEIVRAHALDNRFNCKVRLSVHVGI